MARHLHHQAYYDALNAGVVNPLTVLQDCWVANLQFVHGALVSMPMTGSIISNGPAGPSIKHQQSAGKLDTACTFTEGPNVSGWVTVYVYVGSTCVMAAGYPASSQDADGYWLG